MNQALTTYGPPVQTSDPAPCLAVGIDFDHDGTLARMVCGDPQEDLIVLGWRSFRDLDRFEHYWKSQMEYSPRPASSFLVAIPYHARDSIGIVRWLEAKGVPVYRAPVSGFHDSDLEVWGLPRTYRGALDLCHSMVYRHNAEAILATSWHQLTMLSRSLLKLSDDLGTLASAQAAFRSAYPATKLCPF